MIQIETVKHMRDTVKQWKDLGCSIGFVPTMGYLHAGHVSLIERARQENDKVVVSVFVNPTQFGPNEDFEKYPRDLNGDMRACEKAGADAVFAPDAAQMYPMANKAYVDILELSDTLCGAARAGHFRGVCTVVSKLFNIVSPDNAYFGEKDAQQLAIIQKMVSDLNFPVQIVPCPIVREQSGLAMSSRNAYLSVEEREAATILHRSLEEAKQQLEQGETDADALRRMIRCSIESQPLSRIDYIEVVDAMTLKPVLRIVEPVLVALAVYFGKTRLIDNFSFVPKEW